MSFFLVFGSQMLLVLLAGTGGSLLADLQALHHLADVIFPSSGNPQAFPHISSLLLGPLQGHFLVKETEARKSRHLHWSKMCRQKEGPGKGRGSTAGSTFYFPRVRLQSFTTCLSRYFFFIAMVIYVIQ